MGTKSTAGRTETMSRAWGVKKVFHRACSAAAQAFGFIPRFLLSTRDFLRYLVWKGIKCQRLSSRTGR